jgi:hypothetical protein
MSIDRSMKSKKPTNNQQQQQQKREVGDGSDETVPIVVADTVTPFSTAQPFKCTGPAPPLPIIAEPAAAAPGPNTTSALAVIEAATVTPFDTCTTPLLLPDTMVPTKVWAVVPAKRKSNTFNVVQVRVLGALNVMAGEENTQEPAVVSVCSAPFSVSALIVNTSLDEQVIAKVPAAQLLSVGIVRESVPRAIVVVSAD